MSDGRRSLWVIAGHTERDERRAAMPRWDDDEKLKRLGSRRRTRGDRGWSSWRSMDFYYVNSHVSLAVITTRLSDKIIFIMPFIADARGQQPKLLPEHLRKCPPKNTKCARSSAPWMRLFFVFRPPTTRQLLCFSRRRRRSRWFIISAAGQRCLNWIKSAAVLFLYESTLSLNGCAALHRLWASQSANDGYGLIMILDAALRYRYGY